VVGIIRRVIRSRVERASFALFLFGISVGACGPSYKDAFVDATYPEPGSVDTPIFDPSAVEPLRVNSTIVPLLVSAYDDPNAAAACVRSFGDPAVLSKLRDFGVCLESSAPTGAPPCVGPNATRWDGCMASSFEWLSCSCGAPPSGCVAGPDGNVLSCSVATSKLPAACTALGGADQFRLLTALGQAGEAMVAYEVSTDGSALSSGETSIFDRPLSAARAASFQGAFKNAADTLACDSTNTSATCATSTTAAPRKSPTESATLAISGGAADGAYPAGYVYEMLLARRFAISKDAAAANERFSAVVGTSVGALLAPMIDLAMSDATGSSSALSWCQSKIKPHPSSPPASAAECGLELLRTYMQTSNEWDIVCVENANFLSDFVEGPSDPNDLGKPAFGRFWPAEQNIVKPFYAHFGAELLANGTTRVVMTADTQSKTMLGLDERVCRSVSPSSPLEVHSCSSGPPGMTLDCLPCGVLASVPNPLFARAANRVWTGYRPEGEAGTFLDGGLRSTFPALRAVELSGLGADLGHGTPVLALSTERANSLPSPPTRIGLDLALVSLGSLTHQTHHWELAYATLFEELRRDRARMPQLAVTGAPICGLGTASPSPPTGSIFADFMPAKIDGLEFAVKGYQFDPLVMTGLFIAGRKAFLDEARDQKRNVLEHLRWQHTAAAVKAPGSSGTSYLEDRLAQVVADKATWQLGFPKNAVEWEAHVAARRQLLEDNLELCP